MAKDDMEVIIYKILKYLYECLKKGITPREEDVCCHSKIVDIPQAYWSAVLLEMYDNGLVRGVNSRMTKDGTLIMLQSDFGITLKGTEYIKENHGMQRAKKYLGRAFETILDGIIKGLL